MTIISCSRLFDQSTLSQTQGFSKVEGGEKDESIR
jgi:hypothetical protein